MVAQYTDDLIGTRVVDHRGHEVGAVSDVREGTLYVEVGPDAPAETLSDLNWDGVVNREVHELENEYVSNVSDDIVRLSV